MGLTHGIHVAIEPGKGKLAVEGGETLDFSFLDVSPDAGWMEIGGVLTGGFEQASEHILLSITVEASDAVTIHPIVRLEFGESVQQKRADTPWSLSPGLNECGAVISCPEHTAHTPHTVRVILDVERKDIVLKVVSFAASGGSHATVVDRPA
jgi:hypothetical protein